MLICWYGAHMDDIGPLTDVLPNALLKNGIVQHEFVGVSFIVHTQRKYQFWTKTIRFCYTKQDLKPFVNIMSVKIIPFQVLRNMGMVQNYNSQNWSSAAPTQFSTFVGTLFY